MDGLEEKKGERSDDLMNQVIVLYFRRSKFHLLVVNEGNPVPPFIHGFTLQHVQFIDLKYEKDTNCDLQKGTKGY